MPNYYVWKYHDEVETRHDVTITTKYEKENVDVDFDESSLENRMVEMVQVAAGLSMWTDEPDMEEPLDLEAIFFDLL